MRGLAVMLLLFSSGDALQCYSGMCAQGIQGLPDGVSPCSDELSLQVVTCPQGDTMCMNETGVVNSQEMKRFQCSKPDATSQQLGIENGGCNDQFTKFLRLFH